MKILHVISRVNRGGTARWLSNFNFQDSESRYKYYLIIGKIEKDEVEDNKLRDLAFKQISQFIRPISPIKDITTIFEFRRLVKEIEPDIVNSHAFKAGLNVRISLLFNSKIKGCSDLVLVLSCHYFVVSGVCMTLTEWTIRFNT